MTEVNKKAKPSGLLLEQQLEIGSAARELVKANGTKVYMRVVLWQHDLEKKEQAHGSELIGFKFEVDLHGVTEIECAPRMTPQMEKNLAVNAGTVLNGQIDVTLFSPNTFGVDEKESANPDLLLIGYGIPSKEERTVLMFTNSFGNEFWRLEYEVGKDKVLSKFKIVHNSFQHDSLTKYLDTMAQNRYAERIRQVYGK